MVKHKQIEYFQKLLIASLLVIMFVPVFVEAQLVQIKIDIPTSMGVKGIEPLELISRPNPKTGKNDNWAMMSFSISAYENIQPLVKVCTSGSNMEEQYIEVRWAWQNKGESSPPAEISLMCSPVSFPLSNSGRLIDNMKGRPEMLSAKLFVSVQTSNLPENIVNYESIEIQIEYN